VSAQYIFRMDDITPTMDSGRFWAILNLFIKHGVQPLLGVVPDNRDPALNRQTPDPAFWDTMRSLQDSQAVAIAQHGYQHILSPRPGAAMLGASMGIREVSEFAGETYRDQVFKISEGTRILRSHGLETSYWMAPNHSFDETTLRALVDLGFTAVTDGIALYPFRYAGLTFVPQQAWQPRWMPFGVQTICIHSNEITPHDVKKIRLFLRRPFEFPRFAEVVSQTKAHTLRGIVDTSFYIAYRGARHARRRHLSTAKLQGKIQRPDSRPPPPSHPDSSLLPTRRSQPLTSPATTQLR
jgi:predicted deacetylase